MVAKGATTIWERWNGDTGDVAMNSFNHYALGAITAFLYRRVAGIAAATPGFARVDVRPLLDPRLGSGRMAHDTVHGRIESAWAWDAANAWWYELTLPAGVHARVQLPGQSPREVESGSHRFSGLI
jgi:alpha-L-rhamnosidase